MSNSVTLVGNLVEDPELRFTTSGVAMARVRLAVSRRYRDRDDQWQEETSFFGGTCWREVAENISESLSKGDRVFITGRLQQRSWETNSGEKRYEVEVVIDEIGPSLRWATAQVTKTPRTDGGGGGNYGGGGVPAAPVARDDYSPDEAPF